MRAARLWDLPVLIRIVGDAFTRADDRPSRRRDRFARWPSTAMVELLGVVSREARIMNDRTGVLHVGRRGSIRARGRRLAAWTVTITIVIAVIVMLVGLSGIAVWSVGGEFSAFVAMYAVAFALCGWLLNAARVERRQIRDASDGPSKEERKVPTTVLGPYWFVSNLAALPDHGLPLLIASRTHLEALSADEGDFVVTIAGDSTLRSFYGERGFLPVEGSGWVLSRPVRLAPEERRRRADQAEQLFQKPGTSASRE